MNILIYYNPNHQSFILKYTSFVPLDKKIGFVNQYDHILIQILAVRNNHYINVFDFYDLVKKSRNEKESLKSRIAKKLISKLSKYRD